MKKHVEVVGAVILNDQNEIFCALRSPEMTLPNLWEFPGGKIEQNEKPEDTLRRELFEELQIQVEVGKQVESTFHEYDTFTIQLMTFYAKIVEGTPVLTEHAEYTWLGAEDLYTLEWAAADIPAVQKVQKELLANGALL